ncbi:hypothetical protein ACTFIR_003776 [Dictyostelium discoideum]
MNSSSSRKVSIILIFTIWRSETWHLMIQAQVLRHHRYMFPQVLGTFKDVLTKQSVESIPIQISTTLETGDYSTFQFHSIFLKASCVTGEQLESHILTIKTPQRLENYVFMVKIKESHPTLLSLLDQF